MRRRKKYPKYIERTMFGITVGFIDGMVIMQFSHVLHLERTKISAAENKYQEENEDQEEWLQENEDQEEWLQCKADIEEYKKDGDVLHLERTINSIAEAMSFLVHDNDEFYNITQFFYNLGTEVRCSEEKNPYPGTEYYTIQRTEEDENKARNYIKGLLKNKTYFTVKELKHNDKILIHEEPYRNKIFCVDWARYTEQVTNLGGFVNIKWTYKKQ